MKSLLLAAVVLAAPLGAQQDVAPDPFTEASRALKAVDEPDAETLAGILPLMAEPGGRSAIRTDLLLRDPFPSAALVENLTDPRLAVRLGALELLEEKAGGDFDFNPWLAPQAPTNQGPLARWNQWIDAGHESDPDADLLNEDQQRGYLRDLLGDDRDKAARARHMLETDGLSAVGFLESFLESSPTLPEVGRTRIREAQYQIVLTRAFGEQASTLARHLTFGSRDQMLSALSSLRSAGLAALPILRDFLDHPDPLVRESAIDAMLASGGSGALSVVGPILAVEPDVNVIHGALRRLKDVPGDESSRLVTGFLDHDDEDLLVSAIQTCLALVGGGQSSFSRSTPSATAGVAAEINTAIIRLLDDPRWRVRTAALEFIAERSVSAAEEKVVELLDDPDEFVRFRAITAAARLRAEAAPPKLKQMFLADPEMVGPVLEGYAALNLTPDEEMLAALDGYPPDSRLAAVRAAESRSDLAPLALRYATDPDLDVACAALRFLGADDDRVGEDRIATVLLGALREEVPEKRGAVLDRLTLPKLEVVDPAVAEVMSEFAGETGETALDPLYDAFLQALPGPDVDRGESAIPGAAGKLVEELAQIANGDSDQAFRAALVLGAAGHTSGLEVLLENLPGYSTARKAAIAEALDEPAQREAVELLRRLIRQPLGEIRQAAVRSAFSNDEAPASVSMVFEELSRPDTELLAHELYSYYFESISRDGVTSRVVQNWALSVIADRGIPEPTRVLALVGLRNNFPPSAAPEVLELASTSPRPWIRRAAWHTLGRSGSAAFRSGIGDLAGDASPQVRAVLPEVTGRMRGRWTHRFDDARSADDNSWDSTRERRRLTPEIQAALETMAATDPSAENRFEASFALLSHGREIDAEAFASLLPRQPEDRQASSRVAYWMKENVNALGPGLAPVVAALDTGQVDSGWIQTIAASLAKDRPDGGFASFSALVAQAEQARDGAQQALVDDPGPEPPAPDRESLKLVYFFKPGCQECNRVSDMLRDLRTDFPLLEVVDHNILEATVLNQALCDRFGVSSSQQNIAPSLFTQAGFLVREDIVPAALGKLLADTMKLPGDDAWSVVGEPEIEAAREQVTRRFDALTLPIVIGAGLLDGVNPCAFATIIFFLSYLQIARRTPREMLMVGAAFILAVFLTYFAAGLALHRLLAAITDQFQGIQKWLNWIFGSLALLAAVLSARDAWLAHRGRAGDMTLQLPAFLKTRIRSVTRTGARARHFVIAAFLAGIVISFLELACTGQVYAPIIYQIQQGSADAVGMLLIYNLAFILPLVVIFLAVWAGLRSEALIRFQQRSTATVKILLALLFLVLAAIMFFGSHWLG